MRYMIAFEKAGPVSAEVADWRSFLLFLGLAAQCIDHGDGFLESAERVRIGAEVPGSWDGAAPRRRLDHDDSGHLRMQ
jgi:hypothetical protein